MAAAIPLFDEVEPTDEFAAAFVRAVLEHRGLLSEPTGQEHAAALAVLASYRQQCEDNPREQDWFPVANLNAARRGELAGKAFIMFGAARPTPAQIYKAHTALFGPLLCETCG